MSDAPRDSASEVAKESGSPLSQYNQIDATVWNRTPWRMRLTGSNVTWGKFIASPVRPSQRIEQVLRSRA